MTPQNDIVTDKKLRKNLLFFAFEILNFYIYAFHTS